MANEYYVPIDTVLNDLLEFQSKLFERFNEHACDYIDRELARIKEQGLHEELPDLYNNLVDTQIKLKGINNGE
jgi:hypothetical protein